MNVQYVWTQLGLLWMQALTPLPLSWVRALGVLLGDILFILAAPRRHVVLTNLRLCFPDQTEAQRHNLARRVFRAVAQSWLDRSWLWHGSPARVKERLQLVGATHLLEGDGPTVIFAPHFVGLDATWTALTQQMPHKTWTTIYTDQANRWVDQWIFQGRSRFGNTRLLGRAQGVRPVIKALKAGEPLYLLPDMNFGPEESVFVPFYGIPAATVPSLSRFAKLGQARVVPVISHMTQTGYEVHILEAWENFPTDDLVADTARMNTHLEKWINRRPEEYYWVHKRFKTRPPGCAEVY